MLHACKLWLTITIHRNPYGLPQEGHALVSIGRGQLGNQATPDVFLLTIFPFNWYLDLCK